VNAQGVKMMSMGLLNPGDKPVIWRGPMLHSVITQFLRSVEWGELDYLVIRFAAGNGRCAIDADTDRSRDGCGGGDDPFDGGAGRRSQERLKCSRQVTWTFWEWSRI